LILLAHGVYRSTLGFFARAMLVFAVVSPLTIALLTESLMPFSALDWLKGLMGHGALIAARTDSAGFGRYYIADPDAPVVILLFGLMALTGLALAARLGPALFPKLLYSAALVLWCAGLWYFGLRIPALCYNVKLFGPLLLVAAACLRPMLPLHGATTLRVIQLALAGACCGSLAYTSLVDAMSYRTGVPASALQAAVAPLAKSTARIGLPFAFAGPVSEILEPDRIEITWNAPFDTAAPLLLLRQAGTGETGLPAFPEGWRLVTSRFHKEPLRLFGITLKRARPDWAFALLCRSEICAEFDQPRRPL
jgi:hypothetical protein